MELWFTEKQTPSLGITVKVTQTLHREKTPFQDLAVLDTEQFGRMLVLDGMVMTTIRDEFVYHEMITHVPLFTHPQPKRVLVVGGGDGGSIREVLKHPSVEKAVLAEIDGRVIEASRRFLPEIAGALDDPRVDIQVVDGIQHVREHKNTYDVVIVDSTDPIGPAVGLFTREFYQSIYEALTEEGVMVAQTESPFFNADLIRRVFKDIGAVYPVTRLYTAAIPTYPSGLWCFTLGSKKHDPLKVDAATRPPIETRYYTPRIHHAAFQLPRFAEELLT
jgi:spermidine synthase